MGARLMAIVAEGERGRVYLIADARAWKHCTRGEARVEAGSQLRLPTNLRDFKLPNMG